jgi:hypothetical protein
LKLKCDEPLSSIAFKFNLRRYVEGKACNALLLKVGRCRLPVSKPVLKAPLVSALETQM